MTFKTVEALLSAGVAASGTVTLPYPSGSVQGDFDPAANHLARIAGASLDTDSSDFSLTFNGSDITFTNGASNFTLPKGRTLRVQLEEYTPDEAGADQALTNLDLGASGQLGTLDLFPPTASKGKVQVKAADSAGDTTTTITNASQAAARTYTIPDAGADADFVMDEVAQTLGGVKTFTLPVETGANLGVSAATSVKEYGDGFNHVTVLTATALALPDIADNAAKAVGDLIYTLPAGAIILEAVYANIIVAPAGAENDAVSADVGVGSTIATGAVAVLDGTLGFEDMLTGFAVTTDDATASVSAQQSTAGGPMFVASGDDHTVHVNVAATWLSSAAQTCTYTGTVVLIWKFLE